MDSRLTDQQVTDLFANWRTQVSQKLDDLRVRQWCVERAIESMRAHDGPAFVVPGEPPVEIAFAVVALADQILKFVSRPIAELILTGLPSAGDDPTTR